MKKLKRGHMETIKNLVVPFINETKCSPSTEKDIANFVDFLKDRNKAWLVEQAIMAHHSNAGRHP